MLGVVGEVKVCKSTYLFKVPETPNFSFSQLGHLMEMARRMGGGVHFLQGAPLCGPLGSNPVRFFSFRWCRFSRCFRCVWSLLRSSCSSLAAKSEAEQCVWGGEAPPPARNLLLYSIMEREGGRESRGKTSKIKPFTTKDSVWWSKLSLRSYFVPSSLH